MKTEILPGEVVISVADAEMEKHSEIRRSFLLKKLTHEMQTASGMWN